MSSETGDGLAEIVPDDFTDHYPGDTIAECLEYAHRQAPTTTPADEAKRCPTCGTQRVYPKSDRSMGPKTDRKSGSYVCSERHHFDDPVYGDPEELDLDDEEGDDTDSDADPFVWVSEEDLAEPPLTRQLAALDDETLAALAIFLYRPWNHTEADPSYRELGRIFPYSRTWVGDRVREWKGGEHRDLVADPRPWGRR
jgi:hypothetical protein